MDISKLEDIKELKSLAYDQMLILEQTQKNLQIISSRISQIQSVEPKEDTKKN